MINTFIICIIFILLAFCLSVLPWLPEKFKIITPFIFTVFCILCYYTVNSILGQPRPVLNFLTRYEMSDKGGVVLGLDINFDSVDLMIKDNQTGQTLLLRYPPNDEFIKKLKAAMNSHADANGGEKMGFMILNNRRFKSAGEVSSPFPNPSLEVAPLHAPPKVIQQENTYTYTTE